MEGMMNIFSYKTGKIYFTEQGTGDTIILLHGYLESSEVWNGFKEKLAAKFRVVSVDLPGHGLSDIYSDTHSMEFMATVIRDLMKHLSIKKAFIAGHSLGGYVALAFLELFPEYLSGYSLLHSHPFPDAPEAIEKRLREIAIVKAGKKELMYPDNLTRMFAPSNLDKFSEELKRLKEIASRIPGEGIISVLKGMITRPSRLSVMEEGRVPCLLIFGSMDYYIDYKLIQSKVTLPENSEVVILENSGHIGFIEEEDRSAEVIISFVENLKSM
jgi:pimeloyl-ACP methyl ester carboxylesterase